MIDSLQRNIEYVRISVTDRCTMRCMYCMPKEGTKWLPHDEILSYDEILRVCRILAGLGISKVKLTGGEPLVRKHLDQLVRDIKQVDGIDNVTLTTNGLLLSEQLPALAAAGIDAINISIDSFEPEIFKRITDTDAVEKVRQAIEDVTKYDHIRVKINCVPMRGINDAGLSEIAEIARNHRISVRFIEMMPIGLEAAFEPYTEDDLKVLLESRFGKMTPFLGKMGNGPCKYYTLEGFQGKIGFISAVSHKFCEQCNRVRLTSTGFLKACLQYDIGMQLKPMLRGGASDEALNKIIRETIYKKPKSHSFGEADMITKEFEKNKMFQIGG